MHLSPTVLTTLLASAVTVTAREVPPNVRSFYNKVKNQDRCPSQLQGGFHSRDNDNKGTSPPRTFGYCKDATSGVIYLHGNGKQLVNMDIDCDGQQGGAGEDGRCGSSGDTQSQTSFKDTIVDYKVGISDLNAKVHTYVVFGNDGTSPSFDPQKYGIEPLSVMAVVCGNNLVYGVWGDTNGNDGQPLVGEASIALATACYGTSVNGDSGHDENDVLYVAFPGTDAVPGRNGAQWKAQNYSAFESSIQALGDKLVARL